MTPALEEAHRMLRLARRDRDTFDLLRPLVQANLAALGFHAQQAVEKALKSVAILQGIEFRRTHDLAALAQSIVDSGELLPLSIDEFRSLNPFAVEYRYDDELSPTLTRDALNTLVEVVLAWAERRINR